MSVKFGIAVSAQRMVCGKCGHGKRGDFYPLTEADPCPVCDNTRRHTPLRQHLESLIGQEIWVVVDVWEQFNAIRAIVKSMSTRKVTFEWDYDADTYTYECEPTDIYENYEDASSEAARRNGHPMEVYSHEI